MSEAPRLAVVGCGRLAELGYVPAARLAGIPIASVADPDAGRRDAVAGATGARVFASVEELLAAGGVDGVVVVSPPAFHEEHARACAQAGVAALVEKPPADDLEGARRIAALDRAPAIGFNRRFAQGAEMLERIPAAGELELSLRLEYRRASWRPHQVADPVLLDLAPHLLDLALLLSRTRPLALTATAPSPAQLKIGMKTERGPVLIACSADSVHRESVSARGEGIDGTQSWAIGGLARGLLARFRRGPHPLAASLTGQLEAFASRIRGEDSGLLASAADGVAVMELVDAASRSLASGEEVALGDPAPARAPATEPLSA